jgi:hypothetical protein
VRAREDFADSTKNHRLVKHRVIPQKSKGITSGGSEIPGRFRVSGLEIRLSESQFPEKPLIFRQEVGNAEANSPWSEILVDSTKKSTTSITRAFSELGNDDIGGIGARNGLHAQERRQVLRTIHTERPYTWPSPITSRIQGRSARRAIDGLIPIDHPDPRALGAEDRAALPTLELCSAAFACVLGRRAPPGGRIGNSGAHLTFPLHKVPNKPISSTQI